MNYYSLPSYFAQAYGTGGYGDQTYGCVAGVSNCQTVQGSSLVNTGIAVTGFVTIACLIIFVALVVRIWRRKSNKQTPPTPPVAPQTPDDKQPPKL